LFVGPSNPLVRKWKSLRPILPLYRSLPDGAIRVDQDTACGFDDVEEAISTARWLVGGGGWVRAVIFRREFRPALGLYEDAEVVLKVCRLHLPCDGRLHVYYLLIRRMYPGPLVT
jgi:hypothetical protein